MKVQNSSLFIITCPSGYRPSALYSGGSGFKSHQVIDLLDRVKILLGAQHLRHRVVECGGIFKLKFGAINLQTKLSSVMVTIAMT